MKLLAEHDTVNASIMDPEEWEEWHANHPEERQQESQSVLDVIEETIDRVVDFCTPDDQQDPYGGTTSIVRG